MFRLKIYLITFSLAGIFFIVFKIGEFFRQPFFVETDGLNIIILASTRSSMSFTPPYSDIYLLNDSGLTNLTNDNFYNASISFCTINGNIFFESKRNSPTLGLSEKSRIYKINIENREIEEVKGFDFFQIEQPQVFSNNDTLIGFFDQNKVQEFRIVNRKTGLDIFSVKFEPYKVIDAYLKYPYVHFYNVDLLPSNRDKLRTFNIRENREIEDSFFNGYYIVKSNDKNSFFLWRMKEGIIEVNSVSLPNESINKIATINTNQYEILRNQEVELWYCISEGRYLLTVELPERSELYLLNNNKLTLLFRANYIDNVIAFP